MKKSGREDYQADRNFSVSKDLSFPRATFCPIWDKRLHDEKPTGRAVEGSPDAGQFSLGAFNR